MTDTNYFSGLVKILENPKKTIFKKAGSVTRFRVQFPQIRKNDIIIQLVFWGNLARDVEKYYKINDYVIIEGYISLRDKKLIDSILQKSKIIEVTVLKIYPFLLSSRSQTTKV